VNFNVNFNEPLRKYIVHPLVEKKKDFDKKKTLFTSKLDSNLRKKLVMCYI
jgi:hypothetical protein